MWKLLQWLQAFFIHGFKYMFEFQQRIGFRLLLGQQACPLQFFNHAARFSIIAHQIQLKLNIRPNLFLLAVGGMGASITYLVKRSRAFLKWGTAIISLPSRLLHLCWKMILRTFLRHLLNKNSTQKFKEIKKRGWKIWFFVLTMWMLFAVWSSWKRGFFLLLSTALTLCATLPGWQSHHNPFLSHAELN